MKLQLSVFAEGLVAGGSNPCRPYAVIETTTNNNEGGSNKKKLQLLGRTETLESPTTDPDWAKIFILDDFQLGRPLEATVTIYDTSSTAKSNTAGVYVPGSSSNDDNEESPGGVVLCKTTFDVGTVMGTKGGILGKETKSGAIIMMQVERCSASSGIFEFQFQAKDLKHREGQNVDPFFELQRRRKTSEGKTVWDCVYRSKPVLNNPSPTWDWSCIELSVLCQAKLDRKFRVAIKDFDYEHDKKPSTIGYIRPSVNDVLLEKEFTVTKKKKGEEQEVGKLVVVSASVTSSSSNKSDSDKSRSAKDEESERQSDDDDDEFFVEATDETNFVADDGFSAFETDDGGATFADYIAGGCQLRVTVAIDFTASNGDPRKESSLHHFNPKRTSVANSGENTTDGNVGVIEDMNDYEKAMFSICNVLSEFDSDQKFPVKGFGARLSKGSDVSHSFPCGGGEANEVDGVMGILDAYHETIKGGIGMSKPTDMTHVIREAGKQSRDQMDAALKEKRQEYSILAIFTNGGVDNVEETITALKEVEDDPLSIVVIGVGPSNFHDMKFLDDQPRVKFVDMKTVGGNGGSDSSSGLAEQSLKMIPDQLVSYFKSKDIKPNAPVEADEIFIEPFGEGDGDDQEGQGEGEETPPDKKSEIYDKVKQHGMRQIMRQGRRMLDQQKRKIFGRRGGRPPTNQQALDKMMDQQVNKLMNMFK